jgi:hypothetical protein
LIMKRTLWENHNFAKYIPKIYANFIVTVFIPLLTTVMKKPELYIYIYIYNTYIYNIHIYLQNKPGNVRTT